MKENLRTAFLISGRGSTVEAVMRAYQEGRLEGIEPSLVVSSNPTSPYLVRAAEKKNYLPVPVELVEKSKLPEGVNIGDALLGLFKKYDIQLVSQNGWVEFTPKKVRDAYPWRIINQHPGKTPEFKGLIGMQAVCATLAYAWMTQENPFITSTAHHVIRELDMGNIISTEERRIPMRVETLDMLKRDPVHLINSTREVYRDFLSVEYQNVMKALRLFATGTDEEIQGTPPVQLYGLGANEYYLEQAKELGKQHF